MVVTESVTLFRFIKSACILNAAWLQILCLRWTMNKAKPNIIKNNLIIFILYFTLINRFGLDYVEVEKTFLKFQNH